MRLKGKKVLAVVDQLYNDLEHWYPVYRMREAGAPVDITRPEANEVYTGQSGIKATTDYAMKDIDANDYDEMLLPGRWAPDKLRRYPELLDIVRKMSGAGNPI